MKYGEISSSGMVMRRRDKRVWYVVIGMFVAVFLFTFLTQKFKGADGVEAASLAEFDPGYIISDYQMGRYDAMSEAEIQAFLTKKNPCSNTNYNYYLSLSANQNYTWHFENGHFVCLSEERFGDGEVIGEGETAAHIIWQAAQDYKINPQVLIVLLQKETSLITDPIPNSGDYRKATGYGCPDTAPCSSQYYGFKNQVRKAAALFSTVLNGGWTNYPLGNNYIQYNPNSGCGGSVVNIRSLATSALYRYTPYQPNAGAIAAGYGTAYCGAYGNRNFYLYFQDWFGGITDEVQYTDLSSPRYMIITKETERINPLNEEIVDLLPEGMIRYYDTKIKTIKGEWCLRTEYSTEKNIDACIRLSDLSEIDLQYDLVPEEEQWKVISNNAKKIGIRYRTSSDVADYLIRKFTKKTSFMGVTYYITEFDENNTDSQYGILEEDLRTSGYQAFESVRGYVTSDSVNRVDPYTGDIYDTLENGKTIMYAAQIVVDGVKYYQTKNNLDNNINAAVEADKLVAYDDYKYMSFENPREMVIKTRVNRINPFTGEYYDTLEGGRVIKFGTKIYLNGQWYYRTEHNTINNINAAIPASYVKEK